jgi:hypothetical protein
VTTPNRIDPIGSTKTVPRQTPNTDFGAVLSDSVGQAVRSGAGILSGALGNPVLSSALSSVTQLTTSSPSASKPQVTTSVAGVATLGAAPPAVSQLAMSGGSSWDLLAAQQAIQSDGQSFNMQYLQLQDAMQKESQQFTAVSNIMKVRHDTAKNAINNVH